MVAAALNCFPQEAPLTRREQLRMLEIAYEARGTELGRFALAMLGREIDPPPGLGLPPGANIAAMFAKDMSGWPEHVIREGE